MIVLLSVVGAIKLKDVDLDNLSPQEIAQITAGAGEG